MIDEINDSNNNYPGNVAWLVNDEPRFLEMASTKVIMDYIKQNIPEALVYSNALPIGAPAEEYYGDTSNPGYGYSDYLEPGQLAEVDRLLRDTLSPVFGYRGSTASGLNDNDSPAVAGNAG